MAGLDPAIRARETSAGRVPSCVDARIKPGHDDFRFDDPEPNNLIRSAGQQSAFAGNDGVT
jgi:hypothetical protein